MKQLCVTLFFVGILITSARAQEDLKFGDTANTNNDPTYKPKNKKSKNQNLIEWVKNDSDGLLLGNKCMNEITESMGFEYLIQIKGQSGYKGGFSRMMHNFTAKMGILFKNGPFWKFKLKKERQRCREQTGDFVG